MLGDVNCDNTVNVTDALFVAQLTVSLRSGSTQCPPPAGAVYLPNCDVNSDGRCDIIDALFIAQCTVGRNNVLCPTGITTSPAAAQPSPAAASDAVVAIGSAG